MSALHQCPECSGRGLIATVEYVEHLPYQAGAPCPNCDGTGWLDEHGEPLYLEPETKELTKENP